jgi:hypothetical protein
MDPEHLVVYPNYLLVHFMNHEMVMLWNLLLLLTTFYSRSGLPDIFKPKIPIWVNFGISCNERCW